MSQGTCYLKFAFMLRPTGGALFQFEIAKVQYDTVYSDPIFLLDFSLHFENSSKLQKFNMIQYIVTQYFYQIFRFILKMSYFFVCLQSGIFLQVFCRCRDGGSTNTRSSISSSNLTATSLIRTSLTGSSSTGSSSTRSSSTRSSSAGSSSTGSSSTGSSSTGSSNPELTPLSRSDNPILGLAMSKFSEYLDLVRLAQAT